MAFAIEDRALAIEDRIHAFRFPAADAHRSRFCRPLII